MEETQMNSNKPRMMGIGAAAPNEGGGGRSYYKTQLCRRFMEGTCPHGYKCTYAHGFSDLRRTNHQEPKICRMFSLHKHCTYGHNCRFLHSSDHHHHHHQFNNALLDPPAHPQPQPGGGKNEGSSSAGYRAMQTSTAANTSTNTVATSSLHKNEDPYRVKFIFKENNMRKINGIYADWI